MEMLVWNLVLSTMVALLGFFLKEKSAELNRLQILLNRTREEVAKEYVTKVDVHNDINRVLDRIDRMEAKLDDFIRDQRSAIN
jgi:septum formation topological specificity factor MinE